MDEQVLGWLAVLLLGGMLFYWFVCWTVRRELQDCARACRDPEFRREQTDRLTSAIAAAGAGTAGSARLWQRRGELYAYAGRFAEALADARVYTALAPDDAEGRAELAEYALNAGDAAGALDAARSAARLRDRDDYRALALRACLALNDLDGAAAELAAWETLDAARVANPPKPHRWSLFAQMPRAEIVADPAVAFYRAALSARRGDDAAAAAETARLRTENPDYLEAVNATRLTLRVSPAALPGAVTVPLLPDAARTAALETAAAGRVWTVNLEIPAAAAPDEVLAALRAVRAWQEGRAFPHLASGFCADAARRDAWEAALREE